MHESDMFFQLLILLGSATAVATVFHFLRIPTIVGFIVAGTLIGPYGLKLVGSVPGAHILSEIAVLLLMFTIGMEISIGRLKEMRRSLFGLGLAQVAITVLVFGLMFALVFKQSWSKSLLLGFLVALSSTAIVIKLLQDARDLASPYGKAAVGALVFQDIAVIPMVLALPMLAGQGLPIDFAGAGQMGSWTLKMFATGAIIWGGTRYVVPLLLSSVVKTRSRELLFFAILLLCFGVAYGMSLIGISLALGAFIAGVMISESPYGRQVTADISPLRDNFLSLFFVSIGMLLDISFFWDHLIEVLFLAVIVFAFKALFVYLAARLSRYTHSVALVTAIMLCQIGEFSFILADQGASLGIFNPIEVQYFLCVSILSMVATPFLYRVAPGIGLSRSLFQFKSSNALDTAAKLREGISEQTQSNLRRLGQTRYGVTNHTIIVGFGHAGRNVASAMRTLEVPYKVVEMNYDLLKSKGHNPDDFIYGDATRSEILDHAGIHTAKLAVIAVSGGSITHAILGAIRRIRPDIKVIVRTQYLLEVEKFAAADNADFVVAELEATLEILSKALREYGATLKQIDEFMVQTRKEFNVRIGDISESFRRTIELPKWEAMASIRPIKLTGATTAGKSIGELRLRELTGASIVSVYRPGLGATIPGGDFVLSQDDVIQVIGSDEAVGKAEAILFG